jgi:hypothetical protein
VKDDDKENNTACNKLATKEADNRTVGKQRQRSEEESTNERANETTWNISHNKQKVRVGKAT